MQMLNCNLLRAESGGERPKSTSNHGYKQYKEDTDQSELRSVVV